MRDAYSDAGSVSLKTVKTSLTNQAASANPNAQLDVASNAGTDVYSGNIDAIVQKSLDKFSERITPMLQGVAKDVQLLVKSVAKITGQQEADSIIRSGPAKVGSKRLSLKRTDKTRGLRKTESKAAGSADLTTWPVAIRNRLLTSRKK